MSPIAKYDKVVFDLIIKNRLSTKEILKPIFTEAETSEVNFLQLLVERGVLFERDMLNILAQELKTSCIDLRNISVERLVLDKVPLKIASYYKFVPVTLENNVLKIAVSYPLDIKTQDEIRLQLGFDIDMVLSCKNDITDALKKYYGLGADTMHQMSSQITGDQVKPAPSGQKADQARIEDIEKLVGDASVIRLVNQIILEGFKRRATDIHIEPYRDGVSLRYRVDGILYDSPVAPEVKNFLNAIISRIKIMSNLNIVEKRLPQDGRAIVRVQEQVLDLRISTMPTVFGESVVIRILPTQMLFDIKKLGLSQDDLYKFEDLIKKPHGIIFITGPTGSGKTTTLYACLSKINTKDRKIITLEDPIEYELAGVTQIQIVSNIGLDFAKGLRSVLRHDPDVIMVGEVRDLETAEIATRISLTGHLVLSTLHTNDAASGVTRLIDIGVEPFLVTSSVEAFIAQRLVRLICPDCKIGDNAVSKEIKEIIAADMKLENSLHIRVYKGKGCPKCNNTGFFGRSAIYEILVLDEQIKEMVLEGASANSIKKIAIQKGMRTLRQDGWSKVISGMTTVEEILRVAPIEEKNGTSLSSGVDSMPYAQPQIPIALAAQDDKRVHKRCSNKINIKYKLFKSKKDMLEHGIQPENLSVSKDISAGGVLFASSEILPINSILELEVELPDDNKPITALARVVRAERVAGSQNYNIAVCFLDITSAERVRLNKYIDTEFGDQK